MANDPALAFDTKRPATPTRRIARMVAEATPLAADIRERIADAATPAKAPPTRAELDKVRAIVAAFRVERAVINAKMADLAALDAHFDAVIDAILADAEARAQPATKQELVADIRAECRRLLIRFPNEQMLDRTYRFRPVHDGHWSRLTQAEKDDARASLHTAQAIARRVGEDLSALLAGLRDIPSPGGVDPGVPLADAAD